MKKLILSAFLLIVTATAIFANDALNKLTEEQVKKMVCHKWKLTFLEYNSKKKEIPGSVPTSYIGFLANGTFYQTEGKMTYNGTWTYNHAAKTITTVDKDGTEKHAIIDLNTEQFTMNGKYKGATFNMGLKKAD